MSTERSAERPTPLIDALVDIAVEKFWSAPPTYKGITIHPYLPYDAAEDTISELRLQGIPFKLFALQLMNETDFSPKNLKIDLGNLVATAKTWDEVCSQIAFGILVTEISGKQGVEQEEKKRRYSLPRYPWEL